MLNSKYKLFLIGLLVTVIVVVAKYCMHLLGWEVIQISGLHTSVVTGTFFVIGFLLSATIADYKESERIPSEFSAIIENMYEDGYSIDKNYPKFKLSKFQAQLAKVAEAFGTDVRTKSRGTQLQIHKLSDNFVDMEKAGVPANFIVKLKQQQARLLHLLARVNYIQRITFIPSASILTRSIVILTTALLLITEIEPFYGGLAVVAIIVFILVYILELIHVISTPFQEEGKTQDDVSLFLIDQSVKHLRTRSKNKPVA